jgi:transcriptional regulator with XRE-family HTH domain
MQNNIDIKHALRQARMRCGLEQKQVELLIGQPKTGQISRYESGERIPSLETALKLEIIYKTPIRILFQTTFEQFQNEIDERRKQYKSLFQPIEWFPKSEASLKQEEFCFYAMILQDEKNPSVTVKQMINKHVTNLINTLNATQPEPPKQ